MSGNTSSFLTKSIILLALVLISMGVSMYLGKEIGRNIIALTRSNIEDRFPDAGTEVSSESDEIMLDLVGGRSSFNYSQDEFAPYRFDEEWADPDEEDLEVTSEDPDVEITLLDSDEEISDEENGDETTAAEDQPDTSSERPNQGRNLFDLGDNTTYRIQVGTYEERDNAENVWRDLQQAGFNASISTYTDAERNQTRYRVTVGVYHSREEADSVAEEIRSMGFDGWVQRMETE